MKKGRLGLSIMIFMGICCSQNVFANVTLSVNAKSASTANKIYYYDGTSTKSVTLSWKEKAVYGGYGEFAVTIKNAAVGDLIVKADIVSAESGSMTVTSKWLKYGLVDGPFGGKVKVVELVGDEGSPTGGTAIDKTDLSTICLEKQLTASTTITLFDFFCSLKSSAHIILTAILVDNTDVSVTPTVPPQVIGVDVQTIFFNYIDTSGSEWYTVSPIWLDLIQADENE